ncbi:glycosyltransferase, partial [bacterium]|nr:glycosyltransferase [bacterium]
VGQPGGEIVRRAWEAGLDARGVTMAGILDPRTLWSLGRLLRRERIRVAVANQAREIRLVGLSQLGRGGFRLVVRRGSPDPIKDNWHFRLVYTHLVDRLIVNCLALVEKVCAGAPWFDRGKVSVIPNGVDPAALRRTADPEGARAGLGLPAGARVVSMVGEVGPRKDQETFLRAIALRRRGGAVFLIAGTGPPAEEARLRALTAALGLDDGTVRWLGFRDDVPSLLAVSDVVVLPSREEGFPNALLEAMALGVPAIGTPVDGIPELIADGVNGLLVPVGDPAALAGAMARLLDDEDLRRGLGAAAAESIRAEFDLTAMMDRVESALAGC